MGIPHFNHLGEGRELLVFPGVYLIFFQHSWKWNMDCLETSNFIFLTGAHELH